MDWRNMFSLKKTHPLINSHLYDVSVVKKVFLNDTTTEKKYRIKRAEKAKHAC